MADDFSRLTRPKEPMPAFVREALEQHGLLDAYRERPAYQQNDYLRWINQAKRQETKEKRLQQMLDELRVGGVYMGMKHAPSARRGTSGTTAGPGSQACVATGDETKEKASSREKRPALVNASDAQLAELLARYEPELRDVFLAVHRLIRECLPDVRYATDGANAGTGYGARQYGYDGWGLCALSPHKNWVSLYFMRGSELEDPEGVLEGSGKKMRHVKLRSLAQFEERRGALRRLLEQATAPDARTP